MSYLEDCGTLLNDFHQETIGVVFEVFETCVAFLQQIGLMSDDVKKFLRDISS